MLGKRKGGVGYSLGYSRTEGTGHLGEKHRMEDKCRKEHSVAWTYHGHKNGGGSSLFLLASWQFWFNGVFSFSIFLLIPISMTHQVTKSPSLVWLEGSLWDLHSFLKKGPEELSQLSLSPCSIFADLGLHECYMSNKCSAR